ncbi:N-acetyl-D-Glu racemase DgcA [Sphingosinicella rhizophila]|uniref:Dipeptide epimerase n=1 Tax=Sphingosinicella rhizophila TaxID=3050082 RepID=A0ABU3Q7B1_9SPHN|nr:N-acetyl-D-Glu racemase DgcA [Sphingosinicella sp. GR2756]MDT9598873.1 N-acetyl-D-Glu racemase DgcA [Sphingosinicella sp. GR2756]
MFKKAEVRRECWDYAVPFAIARGVRTSSDLVVVTLDDGIHRGQGESCPTSRYGESVESVLAQVEEMLSALKGGADWDDLHDDLPPGAARNAVDCAIWDWRAKSQNRRVADLLGLAPLRPVATVFTVGIGTLDEMARSAERRSKQHGTLKIKLGDGGDDLARLRAVRAAAPGARLIVDVNEGWDAARLEEMMPELAALGVAMLEQPLPAGQDGALAGIERSMPIGADESCHVAADVEELVGRYDVVNIKLDKTGGLTEAMRLLKAAKVRGFETMIGCMAGTSLAMAPGVLVAQNCAFVDLDAPLLFGQDREPRLLYDGETVHPPEPALWG